MRKLLFFLSLGIVLSLNSSIFAQVVPDKREIRLDVEPGEEVVGSITLANLSDRNIAIKAYFEDFIYEPPYNGIKTLRPLGSTPRSCGRWISVSPQEFYIPGRGKQRVTYSIKVPRKAKGGYYGVLFFEKGAEGSVGDKAIGIVVRTGCSFFLETPDKEKKAKLENISIGKDSVQGYLLNSGNVILVSKGAFYVMDRKGIVVDRGNIRDSYLPPGERVAFTVNLSQKLSSRKHTLFINYDLGEGQVLVKEIDFSKDRSGGIKILRVRD